MLSLLLFFVFPVCAFAGDNQNASPDTVIDRDVFTLYAYIVKNNPKQSKKLSYHLADVTVRVAGQTGLPVALLAAIQKVESNFRVTAVSPKDARGAMQVHYPTWGAKINLSNSNKWMLFAPSVNVPVGAYILKTYLEMEDYNVAKALFRYLGMPDARLAKIPREHQRQKQDQRLNYIKSVLNEFKKYKNFYLRFVSE
jgi:soluble lytic murein transglycosylase-like protein